MQITIFFAIPSSDGLIIKGLLFFTIPSQSKQQKDKEKSRIGYRLVVEETNVLLHKGDAELLSRLEDGTVVLAATRGGNVVDA